MSPPPAQAATPSEPPGRPALEQAAEWFVLLASGEASEADHRRWQAWRAAHPAHEQAWQRAEATAARFANIPRDQAGASLAALEGAPRLKPRGRRKALTQLVVLLAAGFAGWRGYRMSDWSADLVTAIGEQRDMALADGSRMTLDTDSAVDVVFSSRFRLVRLRRGQVLIETAPDPADAPRPFMVETAEGRVLALGTRFTVQQEAAATRVAVLEAAVAVQAARAAGDSPILRAGQAARFNRDGIVEQAAARTGDAAWARGILVADDMALGDFVAELARYRSEALACDPAVRSLRISGAFPLRDTDAALDALTRTLPVRLDRRVHGGGKSGPNVLAVLPK